MCVSEVCDGEHLHYIAFRMLALEPILEVPDLLIAHLHMFSFFQLRFHT
jgi:hypothetical protein